LRHDSANLAIRHLKTKALKLPSAIALLDGLAIFNLA
jgi:hypothetical protein